MGRSGCDYDDCETCPYPDCIATQHQAATGRCGSDSIPSRSDIQWHKEYKVSEINTAPKATIKSTELIETPDERRKRLKHEAYLRSKEKKAKEKKEGKLDNLAKVPVSEEQITSKANMRGKCDGCKHDMVCKYRTSTLNLLVELPENLDVICTYREE